MAGGGDDHGGRPIGYWEREREREKERNKEGEMWVVGCFGYVVVRNPVTT